MALRGMYMNNWQPISVNELCDHWQEWQLVDIRAA